MDWTPGRGPDEIGANLLLRFIPMRRFGKAEELAALSVLLCSDAAGYFSGQVFHVDGGVSRRPEREPPRDQSFRPTPGRHALLRHLTFGGEPSGEQLEPERRAPDCPDQEQLIADLYAGAQERPLRTGDVSPTGNLPALAARAEAESPDEPGTIDIGRRYVTCSRESPA